MNSTTLGRVALAAALSLTGVAAGAAPASAVTTTTGAQAPATSPRTLNLNTEFEPTEIGAGAYEGKLHITVSPDGIVNGYFLDLDDGIGPLDVVGGVNDGDKLWLNVGNRWHFVGTLDGDSIETSTYYRGQTWTFDGKSEA